VDGWKNEKNIENSGLVTMKSATVYNAAKWKKKSTDMIKIFMYVFSFLLFIFLETHRMPQRRFSTCIHSVGASRKAFT